ncbi:MAG: flagellar hook-associated protein FlgK [Proteobacteria bacterium]|nr:flagellar hook-associated protein FlgK [Pseudomonadota bacterium]
MSLLNTAITGILAAQRGLSTVSHNIANVNTAGFSRQIVRLETREPLAQGSGFIGTGVQVSNIIRIHDQFLNLQVRSSISAESEASQFLALASRIDNMLSDNTTGLGPALQNFFNAVHEVADLPSSITSRQVMLSEAQSLVTRFQFLDKRMEDITTEIRFKLGADLKEINSLAQSIALINSKITVAIGQATGAMPNDLLDQRDKLIEELSKFVTVSTAEQSDGALNVFIGNGLPLVLGANSSTMSVTETYDNHFDIALVDSFNSSIITGSITGGELSGILSFQAQMLEPARNSLGRLAIGLADSFNAQHILGQNLDGEINLTFFNVGTADVIPIGTALDNVTATITDPPTLSNSDYSLVYTGADNYILTRLSDRQTTSINTGGVYPFTTAQIDGFTINIAAVAGAVGDQYIIRPTVNGAKDITTTISEPRKIAIAGALRSSVATDAAGVPSNIGNAAITSAENASLTGLPLVANITLTFDSALNQFNISSGGTLAYNPATDSGGKQFSIATAGNATFTISGTPASGDQFIIENNSNADGDNRNANKLAALQASSILLNGTASYQDSYGQIIAEVGTATRQTEISKEALGTLLEQATEIRDSRSGVNLEEEAGNMLKFQQAFQASAQLVVVANTIFQSLINAFR